MIGKSLEDYLKTILILKEKLGIVRSVDVARYMNFSKASVSHAVKLLRQKGLLAVDGEWNLRHECFAEILTSLGVDEKTAEQDACQIEHIVSNQTFEKVRSAYLAQNPETGLCLFRNLK
ncbi:metal-dependent transcriptional regulator [Clostridium sp. Marseille-P2415]|uniref:metal-dependent transcriptional regulator n=1 Tax=Clostridium sp. Marseille-P2415 TaxID=1805471 RepID=UPI002E25E8A2